MNTIRWNYMTGEGRITWRNGPVEDVEQVTVTHDIIEMPPMPGDLSKRYRAGARLITVRTASGDELEIRDAEVARRSWLPGDHWIECEWVEELEARG